MAFYNPCFKPPACAPAQVPRTPSPPSAFVEPLSPKTIQEPLVSAPPHVATGSEASVDSTKPRAFSLGNDTIPQRRSSILVLADAALGSGAAQHLPPTFRGGCEPPHKRSRSEFYPAQQPNGSVSRPVTSYDGVQSYEKRVAEAELLLGFRNGGWSAGPVTVPSALRPHANSYPKDPFRVWPGTRPAPQPLLPAFEPIHSQCQNSAVQQHHAGEQYHELRQQNPGYGTWQVSPPRQPSHPNRAIQPEQESSHDTSFLGQIDDPAKGQHTSTRGRKGRPRAKTKGVAGTVVKRGGHGKRGPGPPKDAVHVLEAGYPLENGDTEHLHEQLPLLGEAAPPKPGGRQAKNKPVTVCAGCSNKKDRPMAGGDMDEWVWCNGCNNWFHIDCAGFKKAIQVRDVDKYFCSACEPTHGKTTYVRKSSRAHALVDYAELQRGVLKTSQDSAEHHYIQSIKDGSLYAFEQESFPRLAPEMVTRDFFEKSGVFLEPIVIPAELNPRPWHECADDRNHDGPKEADDGIMDELGTEDYEYETTQDVGQDRLGMVMPKGLTVRQVSNLVGPETPLNVIDVKTQNSGGPRWNLSRWADYYEDEGEDKIIRNVISLEVSHSKLGRLLQRPKVVRDIDLQDAVWPQAEREKGKWPKVQFYCLMSAADSYTDFHIDFGGSSVYYHILRGRKTFFFIPPKPKHLKAYEEWNDSHEQNHTFLPSVTKECYRVDLSEGDTMLIPSGWIHAVWTPATSLVIGGNFLTRMSYKNQFKVAEIEKANQTPMKFRYPHFQRVMWYAVLDYLQSDPLPAEVSRQFHEGRQFRRAKPIWQDFDETEDDGSSGTHNARYYSQAELDGLPDLVSFIFRTVLITRGQLEGTTADQARRVNASVPKGRGEPVEIAKTFAMWVAWKRGNEDPPAWAHPEALEGEPRKLSTRDMRELERKEPFTLWAKHSDALHVNGLANTPPPAPMPPSPTSRSRSSSIAQQPASVAPQNVYVVNPAGQHVSTPKTSFLGPRRVACDSCRKRRIKCKHKDLIIQGLGHSNGELYGSPPTEPNHAPRNGGHAVPGTNAYVSANIPMVMNGVPFSGDVPRRGRSKACLECRKSKRRCVHDENGNVDPFKAVEIPIQRDAPKRSLEDGSQFTFSNSDGVQPPNYEVGQAGMLMSGASAPPSERPLDGPQFDLRPDLLSRDDSSQLQQHRQRQEQQQPYKLPSLEEIANEVLDMTGKGQEADVSNGAPVEVRPETAEPVLTVGERLRDVIESYETARADHNGHPTPPPDQMVPKAGQISSLPLYTPPRNHQQQEQSPESKRQQDNPLSDVAVALPPPPLPSKGQTKRKRESASNITTSINTSKKSRASNGGAAEAQETADQVLAKQLQQEERGLRRRSRQS
ncbi:hypothetical protein K470DRAFT_278922 [Piedraia hortae CBS 480.64]|uniref:JmjC domain-containing histone demethylation protein 1 n=1 Tax=Piedraia hortae CBS 480.64 TaxID=1314780 RepID=A0A6A7BSC5_9PEZI|nr:hypothetical protein K470DRAFT_278922 [Piedraia hortae CBS 480.64]